MVRVRAACCVLTCISDYIKWCVAGVLTSKKMPKSAASCSRGKGEEAAI